MSIHQKRTFKLYFVTKIVLFQEQVISMMINLSSIENPDPIFNPSFFSLN